MTLGMCKDDRNLPKHPVLGKCTWIGLNAGKAIGAMRKRLLSAFALNCSCPNRSVFFYVLPTYLRFYVQALIALKARNLRQLSP